MSTNSQQDTPEMILIKLKRLLIIFSSLNLLRLKSKFANIFDMMDKDDLKLIENTQDEVRKKASTILTIMDRININVLAQKKQIDKIIEYSIKLALIKTNFAYEDESEDKILTETFFGEECSISSGDFESYVLAIPYLLSGLLQLLPQTKEFEHKVSDDLKTSVKKQFLFYYEMGKYVYESPNYKGSNLEKLEDILFNAEESIEKHTKSRPPMNRLDLSKTFIALVSPSSTGKTQSVFVMRRVRVLYFCIEKLEPGSETQEIYQFFNSFNRMFCNSAEEDIKILSRNFNEELLYGYNSENLMDKSKGDNDVENNENKSKKVFESLSAIYSEISANNLEKSSRYKDHKFFTLGFLKALIQHAEENYNGDTGWMKYYAEPKKFSFPAASVEEFKEFMTNVTKKYCVFLDEFWGKTWAVLARNLCRAVGLRCITANTNSDIVNLLGVIQSFGSRVDRKSAWSLAMTLLNPVTFNDLEFANELNAALESFFENHSSIEEWQFVNSETYQLNREILRIIENSAQKAHGRERENLNSLMDEIENDQARTATFLTSSRNEQINLALFFLDLKHNQIPKLRPGVAFILSMALKSFVKTSCTVNELIVHLVKFIGHELSLRKSKLFGTTIQGRVGTLALYLNNAYETERISPTIEHRKSFLMHHFYYLLNPVDKNPFFLTFAPDEIGENLRVFYKSSGSEYATAFHWEYELTYFDKNELFTILACMSFRKTIPVALEIKKGANEALRGNVDLTNTSNHLSLKSNGNALEVLATASIIEASQHKHGNNPISFLGQDGISFIKNIIFNLTTEFVDNTLEKVIEIELPQTITKNEFNLKVFLENIKIPFLYISNSQVPHILSSLSANQCINVGDCYRTSDDKNEVDINFSCEFEEKESEPEQEPKQKRRRTLTEAVSKRKILKFRAIGEFKNYSNNVSVAELIKILEKALKQNDSRLSLVFCTKIKNCTIKASKIFENFCENNHIRVFKFVKIGRTLLILFKLISLQSIVVINFQD